MSLLGGSSSLRVALLPTLWRTEHGVRHASHSCLLPTLTGFTVWTKCLTKSLRKDPDCLIIKWLNSLTAFSQGIFLGLWVELWIGKEDRIPSEQQQRVQPGRQENCPLTRPFSTHWVTMTTLWTFCSHAIFQKSSLVPGSGPCVAIYSRLKLLPCDEFTIQRVRNNGLFRTVNKRASSQTRRYGDLCQAPENRIWAQC